MHGAYQELALIRENGLKAAPLLGFEAVEPGRVSRLMTNYG
jgi:hypothetical protein